MIIRKENEGAAVGRRKERVSAAAVSELRIVAVAASRKVCAFEQYLGRAIHLNCHERDKEQVVG